MKKYILSVAIAVLMLVGGSASTILAQTTTSTDSALQALQEQVSALLNQITSLTAQIVELNSKQGELRSELSEVKQLLRQQLREGVSGDEVTLLQELLAGDPEIYPEGLVTGYFGPLTKNAVKRFQKKNNIDQVGEVGPLTRLKINELFSRGAGNFGKIPPGLAKKFNLDIDDNGSGDEGVGDENEDEDDDSDDGKKEKNGKKEKVGKNNRFFDGKKAIICHAPSSDSSTRRTINVSIAALFAHLNHGDILGACDGDNIGDGDDDGEDEDNGDDGNEDNENSDDDANGDGEDTTSPVISSLGVSGITEISASISWVTDEDATSKVWYSTSTLVSVGEFSEIEQDGSLIINHDLELSSLAMSTTYYYVVVSSDSSGNTATSSELSFTTADEVVEDTTSPVISNLNTSDLAITSTNIEWTTDEDATSKVWYSTSTPLALTFSLSAQNLSLVANHTLGLSSLTASTTYYFIAVSSDSFGNTATSSEQLFNTLFE